LSNFTKSFLWSSSSLGISNYFLRLWCCLGITSNRSYLYKEIFIGESFEYINSGTISSLFGNGMSGI